MPAKSQAQQIAMAIAEHSPGKLFKRNAGLKKMKPGQLHEFASTPRRNLPKHVAATAGNIFRHKMSAKKGKY